MVQSKREQMCQPVETALKKMNDAVVCLERCEGKLCPEEYTALRALAGHLMDTLYRIGGCLSRST